MNKTEIQDIVDSIAYENKALAIIRAEMYKDPYNFPGTDIIGVREHLGFLNALVINLQNRLDEPTTRVGKIKAHFKQNKGTYIAVGALVAVLALHHSAVKSWISFMEDKGIDPTEYFCPEYFEELQGERA